MKLLHVLPALLCAAALWVGGAARAQTPTVLSGTLEKVHRSGTIHIGYRESSIPFSFISPRGEPIGYSIELCKALVDSISDHVNRSLKIQWTPVTSATRIDAVLKGDIDLECGSTSNTLERQKQVAFSPTIFVAGTKLLIKKGARYASFRDLAGKRIAVTSGTTNEKAIRDLSQKFTLDYEVIASKDHADSFALVAQGQADAFATDDVLLYGLIADARAKGAGKDASNSADGYQVIGDFLSYDPYGVMYRKGDPPFAKVVNDAFHELAQDGEIERQYKRWFLRKLPSGIRLDLPMSAQLTTVLESMGQRTE